MSPPTIALKVEAIHQAIDEECSNGWRRAKMDNVPDVKRLTASLLTEENLVRDGFGNVPLYYSLILETKDGVCGAVVFFFEYSTWEGRVLFLKRLVIPSEGMRLPILQTLAKIAVRLDCVRLVWQHSKETKRVYNSMGASTLDDILTLIMDQESISAFVSAQTTSNSTMDVNDAIDDCIECINRSLRESKIQLKRAIVDDLDDMRNQVQGLATYVQEPDAVKTTLEELRLDGFETPSPMFYCLLLYDMETSKACGVATIFFGYDIDSGRFLYLEDLFVEEQYRKRRAGKSTMLALASIAQTLGCGSFVWQALDWNKPSLEFYERIGARVQENLLTSRFAGKDLARFAAISR